MKKIYRILLLFGIYVSLGNAVELRVIGVAPNDTLNVRKHASHKSQVVATLAPFARGFYTTKALPRDPSSWVPIAVQHTGTTVRGWVKRRYVARYGAYKDIRTSRFSLRYPSYMEAHKSRDNAIKISYAVKAKHYDGCDMRDEPEVVRYFSFFGLNFSIYDSLKSALKKIFSDYYKNGKFDALLQYDEHTGWFKPYKKNGWVEELDFYGKHARRIMIGAEGCGINYYFYRQSGKVVLVAEPYNNNPPIDIKTNTFLSGSWKLPDRDVIIDKIINSMKIKRDR